MDNFRVLFFGVLLVWRQFLRALVLESKCSKEAERWVSWSLASLHLQQSSVLHRVISWASFWKTLIWRKTSSEWTFQVSTCWTLLIYWPRRREDDLTSTATLHAAEGQSVQLILDFPSECNLVFCGLTDRESQCSCSYYTSRGSHLTPDSFLIISLFSSKDPWGVVSLGRLRPAWLFGDIPTFRLGTHSPKLDPPSCFCTSLETHVTDWLNTGLIITAGKTVRGSKSNYDEMTRSQHSWCARKVNVRARIYVPGSGRSPEKGMATTSPVFLPGESHGRRSQVGYGPQGRKELGTTEAT